MSTVSVIQGQLLDVTVVGCSQLKDTEWISRQDPYVCIEYASTKFRTRTCTDGGKNPTFQEKKIIPLIEGLREINVFVWNSNTITFDDFIGSGKVQLHKVLSQGYDDSSWPLQSKSGRFAGEVKLIMHFANAGKPQNSGSGYAPTAPAYVPGMTPYYSSYAPPKPDPYPHTGAYAPSALYPMAPSQYPPANPALYPATSAPYPAAPSQYPPVNSALYPPSAYPPPTGMQQPYPPPPTYPPTMYPPQPYPSAQQQQPNYYPPPEETEPSQEYIEEGDTSSSDGEDIPHWISWSLGQLVNLL